MSFCYCDYPQVQETTVSTQNTDGTPVEVDGIVIPVIVPRDKVVELMASYDPTSGTSPSVTYSRPLARCILDAVKRFESEKQV